MHAMRSAVMWQRSKRGRFPWGVPLLPRPKSAPVTFAPLRGPTPITKYKCMLRPAHATQEIYLVDICEKMLIGDMLTVLERTKGMQKKSLMVVKDGRIVPTYAKAMVALPISFLLHGNHLDAADVVSRMMCLLRSPGLHLHWPHHLSLREEEPGQRGYPNILDQP